MVGTGTQVAVGVGVGLAVVTGTVLALTWGKGIKLTVNGGTGSVTLPVSSTAYPVIATGGTPNGPASLFQNGENQNYPYTFDSTGTLTFGLNAEYVGNVETMYVQDDTTLATSNVVTVTVVPPSESGFALTLNGGSGPLTVAPGASVTAVLTGGTPNGQATVWLGGYVTGQPHNAIFDSAGTASIPLSVSTEGTWPVIGEDDVTGGTSNTIDLTVTAAPQAFALTVNGEKGTVDVLTDQSFTVAVAGGTPGGAGLITFGDVEDHITFNSAGSYSFPFQTGVKATYSFQATDSTTGALSNIVVVTVT
jgi:hypothetical protein